MVSQTASICNHYTAGCTKTGSKILHLQNSEKEKNAPGKAQKGRNRVRFGCWGGVQPVRTGGETRNLNQNAPDSNATHEKRKPAKTQCFRRFCGRDRRTWSRLLPRVPLPNGERPAPAEAGAETGAAERHRGSLAPRHAILEWMWEQPTGSGEVPVLAGSAPSPKGGGLWPPALPARPQSELFCQSRRDMPGVRK